ncbi:2-amino-4-hydroxy-6-hydroxymethyldihydropteridine diphosphokinase [Novosphingobium sp.]|uniref:2-amino-4-hydroxy-6- hydroxymethyldihydropteridine diphosphokinase n=1 Tax=Novosphingobium sp. TaxID=1874826 RepID=UPI0025DBD1BD|nr:2-amino-4-hydroxy-6-hydroxymethyldihydropteridine diphosphokinase [Novosphingobium sp.]
MPAAGGERPPQNYLVALGSNRRHARFGKPRNVIGAALCALGSHGLHVVSAAPVMISAPIGPSLRRYANTVAIVEARLDPPACLAALKAIEQDFGRRARGQRWSARVLDLDIVLWSGGTWHSRTLAIPHPAFRQRDFVVMPARQVARTWRDPLTGLTIGHLAARLTRRRPATR